MEDELEKQEFEVEEVDEEQEESLESKNDVPRTGGGMGGKQ